MNKTFVVLQIVLLQPSGHALRGGAVVADGEQRRAGTGNAAGQRADLLRRLARFGEARQQPSAVRFGDHVLHQFGGQLRLPGVAGMDKAGQIAAVADAILTTVLRG